MPLYGSSSPLTLDAGVPVLVWNNENVLTTPAASSVSQSVALRRHPNMPNVLSVELAFSADPGTFAVDLQVADTDQDKYYVTKATVNTGLNALFVGRVEATNIVAKFARLRMVTKTNAVNATAKFF